MAREVGFKNINVDLMLALPGQTVPKLKQGLKQIIALKPEHISLYSLILEEGTVLNKRCKIRKLSYLMKMMREKCTGKLKEY